MARLLCLLHTQLSIMAALGIINCALVHPRRLQSLHIWHSGLGLALVEMFMIITNLDNTTALTIKPALQSPAVALANTADYSYIVVFDLIVDALLCRSWRLEVV